MAVASVWKGSVAELLELQRAIERNCECARDSGGIISGKCGAHRALVDQRFIDSVLFYRWLRDRLIDEESCSSPLKQAQP